MLKKNNPETNRGGARNQNSKIKLLPNNKISMDLDSLADLVLKVLEQRQHNSAAPDNPQPEAIAAVEKLPANRTASIQSIASPMSYGSSFMFPVPDDLPPEMPERVGSRPGLSQHFVKQPPPEKPAVPPARLAQRTAPYPPPSKPADCGRG